MNQARAANLQTGRGVHPPIHIHPQAQALRANTILKGSKRPRDSPEPSSSSLPHLSDIRREIDNLEARPKISLAAKIAALSTKTNPPAMQTTDLETAAPTSSHAAAEKKEDVLCILSSDEEEDTTRQRVRQQRRKKASDQQIKKSPCLSLIDNVLKGGNQNVQTSIHQPSAAAAAARDMVEIKDEDEDEIQVLDFHPAANGAPLSHTVASATTSNPVGQEVGGNSLLAQLARDREERRRRNEQASMTTDESRSQIKASSRPLTSLPSSSSSSSRQATVLTWNVWFREDLALEERMIQGFSAKVAECGHPDFILVQECTPNIMEIWRTKAPWWGKYECHEQRSEAPYFTAIFTKRATVDLSSPALTLGFKGSQMGRGLTVVRAKVLGHNLTVATSHLESPIPSSNQWFSKERKEQHQFAIKTLDAMAGDGQDVLMGGDFNWTDEREGPMEMTPGWRDAWMDLMLEKSVGGRGGQADTDGYTYDAKVNKMLWGGLRLRLDRFIARLGRSFELKGIEMVGREPIEGVVFMERGQKKPVYASDHFGLLLTIELKEGVEPQATAAARGSVGGGSGGGKDREGEGGDGRVLVPFSGTARRLGD